MLAWGDDHVTPNAACFLHRPLRDLCCRRLVERLNTNRSDHAVRAARRVISIELGFNGSAMGMVGRISQDELPSVTARAEKRYGQRKGRYETG